MPRIFIISLSIIFIFAAARSASAQESEEVRPLLPNASIERDIKGGQTHSYRIDLEPNRFVRVVVRQRGIDLGMVFFDPNDRQLFDVDRGIHSGTQGDESFIYIARAGGSYKVQVYSVQDDAPAASYRLEIKELRSPVPEDETRFEAQQFLFEGLELIKLRDAESMRKSVEKFEKALTLFRSVKDIQCEAEILVKIAEFHHVSGDYPKSPEYLNQALSLAQAAGDRQAEANVFRLLGVVNDQLGNAGKALDYYSRAIDIWRSAGDRMWEAQILTNVGRIYTNQGDYEKALDYFEKSLALRRAVGHKQGEAYTLTLMGRLYFLLGDQEKALECYKPALPKWQNSGEIRGEALALLGMGISFSSTGDYEKALDYYNRALSIWVKAGDRNGQGQTFINIGDAHNSLGDPKTALEFYNQALTAAVDLGNRLNEATALIGMGRAFFSADDLEKAFDCFSKALALNKTLGYRKSEAQTLYEIARLERRRENLKESLDRIKEAISIIELLRSRVGDPILRASFFASVQDYYEFYIDLLMQLHAANPQTGYDRTALEACERARARSLIELLMNAHIEINAGTDEKLIERERGLQMDIQGKNAALLQLKSRKGAEKQAETIEKEAGSLKAEFDKVQAELKQRDPRYAALTQVQTLKFQEIQKLLDPDALLLEYSLGENRSWLWVVSSDSVESFQLPKRAEIEEAARRVYRLLTARAGRYETPDERRTQVADADAEYAEAASALSRMTFGPVQLAAKKRLLIAADGALQYIPFAALPLPTANDEGRTTNDERRTAKEKNKNSQLLSALGFAPLVVEHEIISIPSASTLAALRAESANSAPGRKTAVVLADPVFSLNDPRIKRAGKDSKDHAVSEGGKEKFLAAALRAFDDDGGSTEKRGDESALPRLLSTRDEAESLAALVPESDRKIALGFEASRTLAMSGELQRYGIIHFATHGFLNSAQPELSGIALSLVDEDGRPQNGFLRLQDVYNLTLPAELVVLSACRTALGKEVKGEGLVGLTRGFMYAGSARVAASLWKVDDEASAELMRRFYEGMLKKNLKPAAALRAAQIDMLRDKRRLSPFYWAAFVLQGEW